MTSSSDKRMVIASLKSKLLSFKMIINSLGLGIITGSSADDPSSIATLSQAGSLFGFEMLWVILFQYPLMTIVQEICARTGLVTGSGLATLIKKRYSMKIALPFTLLLLVANTIDLLHN